MRKLMLLLAAMMVCTWTATAQNATYSGTVKDGATGEPLIGATVMPIGGGHGVATDLDGRFTITVPDHVSKARFSYIGFAEQTAILSDGMTIRLHSEDTALQDVVVVAYGTANKESLTGSVAVVGSKDIEERPITSVTAALEGNAPGVQVNNSTAAPGDSPSIRIRGFNSINGANGPLYVVDGTVYSGDISTLNPQDIESMSILKDAASCALYGSRGANGVILITTKRARKTGKVDVTLQVAQGWNDRALPFYDRLGANEWMETGLRALANGLAYDNAVDNPFDYARQTFISQVAKLNIYDAAPENVFDAQGKIAAPMLAGYAADRDWWKAVSQTGSRQEYNVNVAGATEKFNAYASAGYLKTDGYLLQTDFERYNGRISLNAHPVSYFRMGLNIAAAQTETSLSPLWDAAGNPSLTSTNNPFRTAMTKAPIYPYYAHDAEGNLIYGSDGHPEWSVADYNDATNIAWAMREDRRHSSATQIDGSIFATAILPYGFEITVKGALFRSKSSEKQYSNRLVGAQQGVGSLSTASGDSRNHTFQQMVNWSHDYGLSHIDVLLDHENFSSSYSSTSARKSGQQLPGLIVMGNFEEMKGISEGFSETRSESYLGRVRYNYDQKYFGEASLRRDGSSRFADGDQWGTFWSVGASWIISREKWLQTTDRINYLKLRAAYGSVGNDASAPAYASKALYGFGWALEGNTAILQPSQLAPDHLKWESTSTFDIALEGTLFDDRLNFSAGYYNKKNSDLLFWVSAPYSAGTLGNSGERPQILQNIGDMRNTGWEIGVGVDIIRSADWKWSVSADASFLKNRILRLPEGKNIPDQSLFQGKTLYENYYAEWAGVDLTTGQSLYAVNPSSPDYYEYDDNGDFVFNETLYNSQLEAASKQGALVKIGDEYYTTMTAYAGRKIMSTALPTVYGSFGTNLSWRGISLAMLFTYSLGGQSYDSNYATLSRVTTTPSAIHSDLLKSWSAKPAGLADHTTETATVGGKEISYLKGNPGDIDPNGIPQLNTSTSSYNNPASSRFLTSNNYLVFKNINLSYDFPESVTDALKMQGLRIGFAADNLFIASKRKGFNPQYSFNGSQGAYFVPTRTFNFQLTVKF